MCRWNRRTAWLAVAWLVFAGRAAAVAPEIKDEGKFFSAEAIKKANEQIRDIYHKYDRDLLVETFPSVPPDMVEKVKGMTTEEKEKFFEKWARERTEAAVVNGVYILVCKEPPHVRFDITAKAHATFDSPTRKKLQDILLEEFRAKHFDDGLLAAVKFIREKLAASK